MTSQTKSNERRLVGRMGSGGVASAFGRARLFALLVLSACVVLVGSGCQQDDKPPPPMAASLAPNSTPGDRFEVIVPADLAVVIGSTRTTPNEDRIRTARYDRVVDGKIQQTARNELRDRVELPAVATQSFLYVDAVQRASGAAADADRKSKLSSTKIGEGIWRLSFSDDGGMFSQPNFVVTVRFITPAGVKRSNKPAMPVAAGAATGQGAAAAIVRTGAGESVQVGDLTVRLTSAVVAPLPAQDTGAGGVGDTEARTAIRLTLAVDNASTTRKVTFQRWSGSDFPFGGNHIVDNYGNAYRLIPAETFNTSATAPAVIDPVVNLYPGKSVSVDLSFETPVPTAQFLDLDLPAKNVGGAGSLHFRVPANLIKR